MQETAVFVVSLHHLPINSNINHCLAGSCFEHTHARLLLNFFESHFYHVIEK